MYRIFHKNKNEIEPRKNVFNDSTSHNKKILNFVSAEKEVNVKDILERGDFGASPIIQQSENDDIKVKVLKTDFVSEEKGGLKMLDHRNLQHIVKLENTKNRYTLKTDSYLFYRPIVRMSLQNKVEHKGFRKDPQAIFIILKWLEEICDATKYLHASGYALMNIHSKSIVINEEGVPQIADFHDLSSTDKRSNTFGVIPSQRPPEAFFNFSGSWPVKPEKFDSWSIGILIIELFTNFHLSKKLPCEVCIWGKEVYPVLYKVLKIPKFCKLVRKAFPKAYDTADLNTIRNMAVYAMSIKALRRPSAKEMHELFIMMNFQKTVSRIGFPKDDIWESKMDWENMKKYFSRMSAEETVELLREENLRNISIQISANVTNELVTKSKNDSSISDSRSEGDKKRERGSKVSKKDEGTKNYNNKHIIKNEESQVLKKEDRMIDTVFAIQKSSRFEKPVFDKKFLNSEISGCTLDKTNCSNSNMQEYAENIHDSIMNIGDASPSRKIMHTKLVKVADPVTKKTMENDNKEKELREKKFLINDISMKKNEKVENEIDLRNVPSKKPPKKPPRKAPQFKTTFTIKKEILEKDLHTEDEKFLINDISMKKNEIVENEIDSRNVLSKKPPKKPPRKAPQLKTAFTINKEIQENYIHIENRKEILCKITESIGKEEVFEFPQQSINDFRKKQDESKNNETIFCTGMQLVNKVLGGIKWAVDLSSNNYEMTSTNNYLHNLSKRLSK